MGAGAARVRGSRKMRGRRKGAGGGAGQDFAEITSLSFGRRLLKILEESKYTITHCECSIHVV